MPVNYYIFVIFRCIATFVGSTNKLISLINEITFIQIW